jgi:nucleoid-associated protein YgaU
MRDIPVVAEHIVQSGERPDLVAAQTLGDPELYWRISDANAVADPFELNTVGLRIRIPAPVGL